MAGYIVDRCLRNRKNFFTGDVIAECGKLLFHSADRHACRVGDQQNLATDTADEPNRLWSTFDREVAVVQDAVNVDEKVKMRQGQSPCLYYGSLSLTMTGSFRCAHIHLLSMYVARSVARVVIFVVEWGYAGVTCPCYL